MKTHAQVPLLLRAAMASTLLGALLSLVAFMFLAQPLLLLGMLLFAVQVFKDLRREKLL